MGLIRATRPGKSGNSGEDNGNLPRLAPTAPLIHCNDEPLWHLPSMPLRSISPASTVPSYNGQISPNSRDSVLPGTQYRGLQHASSAPHAFLRQFKPPTALRRPPNQPLPAVQNSSNLRHSVLPSTEDREFRHASQARRAFRLILEKNVRLKLGAGGYEWQGKGEIRYVDITDEPLTQPIVPSRSKFLTVFSRTSQYASSNRQPHFKLHAAFFCGCTTGGAVGPGAFGTAGTTAGKISTFNGFSWLI